MEFSQNIFRHLLSDRLSLRDYVGGQCPDMASITRRLFLLERESQPTVADHYHRMKKRFDLANSLDKRQESSLSQFLQYGLSALVTRPLFLENSKQCGEECALVRVEASEMNHWQDLITRIPPLPLLVVKLHCEQPIYSEATSDEYLRYFKRYLLPNLRYTALPTPKVLQIEHFMLETKGFQELHIHLNGTTETDVAWQKFLFAPNLIYETVQETLERDGLAREQFEEVMTPFTGAMDIRTLLFCARLLRSFFYWACFTSHSLLDDDLPQSIGLTSREALLCKILNEARGLETKLPFRASNSHPFAILLPTAFHSEEYSMAIEGLMHAVIMTRLEHTKSKTFASMYHFYLLILGAFHQLIVQQTWQVGFDQFQKITMNDLRWYVEKKSYFERFTQLAGNDADKRLFRFIEGRFAPKDNNRDTHKLVNDIVDGWRKFKDKFGATEGVQLSLIAHFIKRKDDTSTGIRHAELRKDLSHKAEVLFNFCNDNPELGSLIKGIDAASSEFDAPPEVFAPIFRWLRKRGFKHFTYHAGEDFYHLLGGLRAIYEAIVFCELSAGDRIGHAVAAGLDPHIWQQSVGNRFYMRQGEYLDDLLFTYCLLFNESKGTGLLHDVFLPLKHRIKELSVEVYGGSYSLKNLESAWRLRGEDPLNPHGRYARCSSFRYGSLESYAEVMNLCAQCGHLGKGAQQLLDALVSENIQRFENDVDCLLWKYHNERQGYEQIIEVNPTEIFTLQQLEELQLLLLHFMCKHEIVIETLPTSNVRIGRHANFDTYHLKRWMEWRKAGKSVPPIVLGTDDPGIFVTNLYNEYANVYCNLIDNGLGSLEAMNIIREIEQTSSIYRFD